LAAILAHQRSATEGNPRLVENTINGDFDPRTAAL